MARCDDAGSPSREQPASGALYSWEHAYPPGVDWWIDIPDRPLWTLLDEARRSHGSRPAVDFLGKHLTYRELHALVERATVGFRALGVRNGTRVGLFLPNCPYFVICLYAVLKAGGIVVTFNPLLAREEVRQQIADSGTDIFVTLDLRALYEKVPQPTEAHAPRTLVICRLHRALPWAKGIAFRLKTFRRRVAVPRDDRHVAFEELLTLPGSAPLAPVESGQDIAVLLYTAGTTGQPKGVALTHRNLLANALQCRAWFTKASPGHERILAVLPFFHAFGLSALLNFGIALGAELIILPRFEPKEVLKSIGRLRPTFFGAVPTMLRALLNAPEAYAIDFSSLKICISGGDALPLDLRARFQQMTGVPVTEGYGLSESGPVVTCGNPLEGRDKPGSVGLPLPGTVVEILSLDEARTPLGPGETGEICLRGPQIMSGYWRQPELTQAALVDGRLSSGDLGYLDDDGYLFVVDRLKDVIITGGYTVYPSAIEAAICRHPAVAEAAVVGLQDDYWGEVIKAFVVPAAGRQVTAEELVDFLEDHLSAIERPKSFVFRDALPKSVIGKVLRRQLRGT